MEKNMNNLATYSIARIIDRNPKLYQWIKENPKYIESETYGIEVNNDGNSATIWTLSIDNPEIRELLGTVSMNYFEIN